MQAEIVLSGSQRGQRMLRAMADAAPIPVRVTEKYQGNAELLMMYGVGHPERLRWWHAHKWHRVAWDLGYWDRKNTMRMSVGSLHPKIQTFDMPSDRWEQSGIRLRDDFEADGPIVLVGLGIKSRAMFGLNSQAWETSTLKRVRKAYPGRTVVYRPKKYEKLASCPTVTGEIESVLCGASLVVCRHSNVAVDACIAGVPVVCEDGAASALYGSDLTAPRHPDETDRLKFLERLAWWQWKPEEVSEAWKFLLKVLG